MSRAATSDTIVLCRPDQLREAAIVLSCLPRGPTTPLIVLERPPTSEAEYRELYAQYVEIRDTRDEVSGGTLGREEFFAKASSPPPSNEEVDVRITALTPYRAWVKRNRFIFDLLQFVAPRRAVYLFDPDESERSFIEPTPFSQLSDERFSILPAIPESLYLRYSSLEELSEVAWQRLRKGSALRDGRIEIAQDDTASYFTGLYRSLQSDAPLHPRSGAATSPVFLDWSGDNPKEAVLIEATEDASRLLGVLYAARQHARLVVCQAPETGPIEKARAAVQQQREQENKNLRDAFGQFFNPDQTAAAIRNLEKAVSKAVHDSVVAQVGDLDLTAVTTGTPYSFVKKKGADWSTKAIGHIAGDTSLLLLTELFGPSLNPEIGFNLIFDPKFFKTTETQDVLSELRGRVSYSLVLSEDSATSHALLHLSGGLPVELVFFNTHGSDEAIVLKDMVLPGYKLVQRVMLRSRPVVFNNSCLSWTGVGREFVDVGARGYTGTLWSVGAADAGEYAQTVIRRVVRDGSTVPRAMHGSGVKPVNERAYIFIGPCSMRLEEPNDTGGAGTRGRLTSCARYLLSALKSLLDQGGVSSTIPYVGTLCKDLFVNAITVIDELDAEFPQPDVARFDMLLQQFDALADLITRGAADPQLAQVIYDRGQEMLPAIAADHKTKASKRALLDLDLSRVLSYTGLNDGAINLLKASIESSREAGELPAQQYMALSDAQKTTGDIEAAEESLKQAVDLYQDPTLKNGKGPLLALGRAAQLALRLRKFDDALNYAQDGSAKAERLDDMRERTAFKGDETRAYFGLQQYDNALKAAREQLSLARRAHDDGLELRAYGNLTRALIFAGELSGALEKATAGLRQAERLRILPEIGDFALDIAEIKRRQGDLAATLQYLCQATYAFALCDYRDRFTDNLGKTAALAFHLGNWDAIVQLIHLELALMDRVERDMRIDLCDGCAKKLKMMVTKFGLHASAEPLATLEGYATPEPASEHRTFILRLIRMLRAAEAGHTSEAHNSAAALDIISDNAFNLTNFLTTLSP